MNEDELVNEIIDSILNNPNKTNIWEDITPEIHQKVINKLKLLGWSEQELQVAKFKGYKIVKEMLE